MTLESIQVKGNGETGKRKIMVLNTTRSTCNKEFNSLKVWFQRFVKRNYKTL